jgi:hypothetical protein
MVASHHRHDEDGNNFINPEAGLSRPSSETGLFGLGGGPYVPLTDIKVISETKTAVIELGFIINAIFIC